MNLAGIIDPHPADAPALISGSGELTTYGSLRQATISMQARLADAGVAPGDRVAIMAANDEAFVVAYLGALRCGAVAVPLNPMSPPAELRRQLGQVDVSAIIVGPGCSEIVDAIEPGPDLPVCCSISYEIPYEIVQQTAAADPEAVDRRPEDLAALLFTAGTAGAPRAAMLTHGNLLANLDQVQRHPGRGIDASDCLLGVLPLSHIFGLNAVLGSALFVGARVLLLERFEPRRALELILRHQVTVLAGTPTLYAALAAVADKPTGGPGALASVRLAFSGAAPLSAGVAEAWQQRFGLPLRQGYGLTEAAPVVTTSVMDEPARPGSIGVAIPGVEIRLVDDDEEDSLAGDPGEIWVRGPNVFPGYWRDDEATAAAITPDGWLRTGDIAVIGDDGDLSIVDRAKDLIIVSGFNVYPAEVEEVLAGHPAVAEVAVIGDADAFRGEAVHAFVVLKGADVGAGTSAADTLAADTLAADTLAADTSAADTSAADTLAAVLKGWCGQRLARYKCPAEITFVPSLPHGVAGKLLRRSLRPAPKI